MADCMYIEYNYRFKTSMLKKRGLLSHNHVGKMTVSFQHCCKPVEMLVKCDTIHMECRFIVSYNGNTYLQTFALQTRDTNLGIGQQWFFICPKTGRFSRNLYYYPDEQSTCVLFTRWMMHDVRYDSQLLTPKQREESKKYQDSGKRRYGKVRYRGKLTPYGRRLMKYG